MITLNASLSDLLQPTSRRTLPDPFIQGRDARNGVSRVHRDLWKLCFRRGRQGRSRVDRVEGTRHLARIRVAVRNRYRGFGRYIHSTLAFDQRSGRQVVSKVPLTQGRERKRGRLQLLEEGGMSVSQSDVGYIGL